MADYIEKLREDLVDQFRDKEKIDALLEVLGEQLNDVYNFFVQLRDERDIQSSVGKQLDGIGDIVVLSRKEGGELACVNESTYVLSDDEYRKYLFYKIWLNSNDCTYYDIIKALQMFWAEPLYYSEDPEQPATMIFNTELLMPGEYDNVDSLRKAPLLHAAGVGIKIKINEGMPATGNTIYVSGIASSIMRTTLPSSKTE